MAEAKTAKAPAVPAAEANGHKPGPVVTDGTPAEDCVECLTSGERLVGLVGIAIGVGVALIGVDLLTGGAVSGFLRGLAGRAENEAGDDGPAA
jgi:hypothetical protein